MSDTAIVAIVTALMGAIPPTLLAWATLRESKKTRQEVKAVKEQAVEIRTLADGNLSKVNTALEVAHMKIEGLEKLVSTLATSRFIKKEAS